MFSVDRSSGKAAMNRLSLYAYQHWERLEMDVTASRAGKNVRHQLAYTLTLGMESSTVVLQEHLGNSF